MSRCRGKGCCGDYKAEDQSRSSVQAVEASAVMHKVLPLWSGFVLNVLSFKGSEKLNTSQHKGVAKPSLLRLPPYSLKGAQGEH